MDRWWHEAACQYVGLEPFYAYEAQDTSLAQKAIAVCERCPVKIECLESAMREEVGLRSGIRGGLSAHQREILGTQRRRHAAA